MDKNSKTVWLCSILAVVIIVVGLGYFNMKSVGIQAEVDKNQITASQEINKDKVSAETEINKQKEQGKNNRTDKRSEFLRRLPFLKDK